MSNYLGKAKNPNTGNLEDCVFLDDFYGKRQYAVRFKDGTTYPESEVKGQPMVDYGESRRGVDNDRAFLWARFS